MEEEEALIDDDKDEQTTDYWSITKGVLAAAAYALLATASGVSVQLLERRIPDFQLNVFRNIVPLVMNSVWILFRGDLPRIETGKIAVTFIFTFLVFVSAFAFYVSISLLPAALATCLRNTSCLVSGLVLFSLLWKERLNLLNSFLCVLCVTGFLMTIQPWNKDNSNHSNYEDKSTSLQNQVLLPLSTTTTTTSSIPGETGLLNKLENYLQVKHVVGLIVGYVFGFMSGFTQSGDILLMKRYPYISHNFLNILFWVFVCNTVYSTILMTILEAPVLPSNWFDTSMIAVHSFSCAGMWHFYTYAPKYISGNTFTLILTTDVVIMLICQYTFLSPILPGHRNWIEVTGGDMRVAGFCIIVHPGHYPAQRYRTRQRGLNTPGCS